MAVGDKYAALTQWLQNSDMDDVLLSFEELNKIIPIPSYAWMLGRKTIKYY